MVPEHLREAILEDQVVADVLGQLRGHHPPTYAHSLYVADVSLRIGTAFGLDEADLEILRQGAFLHDAGKLDVPQWVLSNSGKLDEAKLEMIYEHPRHGFRRLEGRVAGPVGAIIVSHHEFTDKRYQRDKTSTESLSYDGPERRTPQDTFLAEIVAAADTLAALMEPWRSYRDPMDLTEARSVLKGNFRGNPAIIDTIMQL